MRRPTWLETEAGIDGQPLPHSRFRYIHACGHRGKWTAATAAQIGYHTHARSCRKPGLIEAGSQYLIQHVAGGHDVWVLVRDGERASAHSQHNWLLVDRDDHEGARRLLAFVRHGGGTVVNAATFDRLQD